MEITSNDGLNVKRQVPVAAMFIIYHGILVVISFTLSITCYFTFPKENGSTKSRRTTTEFDYHVPDYIYNYGRTLKTIEPEELYQEDLTKVFEALGPRNDTFLRTLSIEWDKKSETDPPDTIEKLMMSSGEVSADDGRTTTEKLPIEEYESHPDSAMTIPLISIWPGWTPFTFHFRTPAEIAFGKTPEPQTAVLHNLDDVPGEPLKWDHLIHHPKMIVIDFDYTLVNFTTDVVNEPLKQDASLECAIDDRGNLFTVMRDVKQILTELRAKGLKTGVIGKERRPYLIHDFINASGVAHLIDFVHTYSIKDPYSVREYLRKMAKEANISPRDIIYFDEDYQGLKEAFRIGSTPQRCYHGITMRLVNLGLEEHNQLKIHGVLPKHLFFATGVPGIDKEQWAQKDNPIHLSTISPEDYKKEYDKHIAALNKNLKPGHPPFPRWTKWYKK